MKNDKSGAFYFILSIFLLIFLGVATVVLYQNQIVLPRVRVFMFVGFDEVASRLVIYKWLAGVVAIYFLFFLFYSRYAKNKKLREERLSEKFLQEQSERGGGILEG
ncbi:MAG: hypothetical protein WC349_01630 [Patescibacteria group bacterium]|jgi:uncharacterized BrkB/YihY/UPF0761 family membrane protein